MWKSSPCETFALALCTGVFADHLPVPQPGSETNLQPKVEYWRSSEIIFLEAFNLSELDEQLGWVLPSCEAATVI